MKNLIRKTTLLLGVLIIFSCSGLAQTKKLETAETDAQTSKLVKQIEAYAETIADFVEKQGKPHLIIADVSDYTEAKKPVWKKFASEDEFEKARETTEAYTIAYIWQKGGKTVAVNFTYSSPSGDWAHFIVNTYRADGTLAKTDSRLNTFYGDAAILRTFYFDAKGKKLKETVKYQDLQSDQPFDPKTRDFFDQEAQIYKNVNGLPFANLLKTPVKKRNPKVKRRNLSKAKKF